MALLTKRQLKFYLGGVGLVTLLALFITVLIMLLGGRAGGDRRGTQNASPGGGTSTEEIELFSAEDRIVQHLEVPEEYKELFVPRWKPFRPVYDRWSPSQIEPFWIDPKKIVEEQLKKESNRAVRGFLEELP